MVLVAPPENDDRPQSSRRPAPAADESVASTADGKVGVGWVGWLLLMLLLSLLLLSDLPFEATGCWVE